MFTHPNELAIASCYLYTFAISKLIQGKDGPSVYELTKKEASNNANLQMYGVSKDLVSWFEMIDND